MAGRITITYHGPGPAVVEHTTRIQLGRCHAYNVNREKWPVQSLLAMGYSRQSTMAGIRCRRRALVRPVFAKAEAKALAALADRGNGPKPQQLSMPAWDGKGVGIDSSTNGSEDTRHAVRTAPSPYINYDGNAGFLSILASHV